MESFRLGNTHSLDPSVRQALARLGGTGFPGGEKGRVNRVKQLRGLFRTSSRDLLFTVQTEKHSQNLRADRAGALGILLNCVVKQLFARLLTILGKKSWE